MPNFITNTAIVNESWNARGLITHNAVTKALVRADDGTLWAAVREAHVKEYINIYRSSDGGFSWENMFAGDFATANRRTGIAGLNQNGPFLSLTLNEERDRLILWHSYYDTGLTQYNLEPFIFEITSGGLVRKTEAADNAVTSIVLDADQLAHDVTYTSNHIFLSYVDMDASAFHIRTYHWNNQISAEQDNYIGNTYFNVFSTHANNNGDVDIVIVKDDSPNYTIQYIKYNRVIGWSAPVTISTFPAADVADMNVERDGRGNILAYWNQETTDGTSIMQKYALSTDSGLTWTINEVPYTAGQSAFKDLATDRLSGRTVALGGLQGFLVGYVRLLNTTPTAYIRTLLWDTATSSYTLGEEKKAVDQPVTGFRFFRPTGTELLDLDQIGQIRIAYQMGYATSTVQQDREPVIFDQQLLRQAAAFEEAEAVYTIDSPDEGELLVTFNLLGAPDENIDYYAEGLTGSVTNKYLGAFNKAGTVLSFYRYEPNAYAETSDRSAYSNPTVRTAKAILQPQSYDFPLATGNESFQSMVERDHRKIHLPPNFHLSRTFVVNNGNHLKRTVWLVRYDGNEYELSQVVPRFLRDQIAYYEANAYVVGPSNDPFSRVILPSET